LPVPRNWTAFSLRFAIEPLALIWSGRATVRSFYTLPVFSVEAGSNRRM